jgi:protein involved in polysaccharide export with SLBB domain
MSKAAGARRVAQAFAAAGGATAAAKSDESRLLTRKSTPRTQSEG